MKKLELIFSTTDNEGDRAIERMVLKQVNFEITKEEYQKIKSDFDGRSYGNYHGLNVVVFQNISGKHYIVLTDHIEKIIP